MHRRPDHRSRRRPNTGAVRRRAAPRGCPNRIKKHKSARGPATDPGSEARRHLAGRAADPGLPVRREERTSGCPGCKKSMETLEALKSRKSVRKYTNDVISEENLDRILTAAQAAPAAMGRYDNFHLTVLTDAQLLDRIDRAAAAMMGDPDIHPLYGAPMLVVVSIREPEPGRENPAYSTAACMVENMALEAVALNVGACHIWGPIRALNASEDLVKALELPEGFTPSCGIILGQTEEEYTLRDIPEDRIKVNYVK